MKSDYRFKLLCRIANAKSLNQLANLAYELLGNPIFIADMAHTMLAYTTEVTIPHESWQKTVVEGRLDRNMLSQDREINYVHKASVQNKMPLLVNDDDLPYSRIIKALIFEGNSVGVVVLTAYLRPLGPDDVELMELISSHILDLLVSGHYTVSKSDETVENYLLRLMEFPMSRERIRKRFDILSYSPRKYTYAMAAQWEPLIGGANSGEVQDVIDDLSKTENCKVFLYESQLIIVCDSESEVKDWQFSFPSLLEKLKSHKMRAGVSRSFSEWENFRTYVNQAISALELGIALRREELLFFHDLFTSYLLFSYIPDGEILEFCHQKIQKLDRYDQKQNSSLCITLQVYLEQARSLYKTSEILFIHRNTVRYRINKCMELMETDFEDGNEIFAFILSLRILEFRRKQINLKEEFKKSAQAEIHEKGHYTNYGKY